MNCDDDGQARYSCHSSGVPFLIFSIFIAEFVKGMATMS